MLSARVMNCPNCYGYADDIDCHEPGCAGGELYCACGEPAQVMRQVDSSPALEPVCEVCVAGGDAIGIKPGARTTLEVVNSHGVSESVPVVFASLEEVAS